MTSNRTGPAAVALTLALVHLADQHGRPPCGDYRDRNPWLSEDAAERAQAVPLCASCPVLAECGAAADEAGEQYHVWGGRDRTPPPRRGSTPCTTTTT